MPLSACGAPVALRTLSVLARTEIAPDDLFADADGTLWVSDPDSGSVEHLDAHGAVLQRITDGNAPEGIARLSDGTLLLAEQRTNRIVRLTPEGAGATVLTLPPPGANLGVDGIATDPAGMRTLIPDSAHGTLLALPFGATPAQVLAGGLGRPVDAIPDGAGGVWVATEIAPGLRHAAPDGAVSQHGAAPPLDDLVLSRGLLYATAIDSGTVLAIDPATGASRVLVTGIGSAQGLAPLGDGRIALADSTSRLVALLPQC